MSLRLSGLAAACVLTKAPGIGSVVVEVGVEVEIVVASSPTITASGIPVLCSASPIMGEAVAKTLGVVDVGNTALTSMGAAEALAVVDGSDPASSSAWMFMKSLLMIVVICALGDIPSKASAAVDGIDVAVDKAAAKGSVCTDEADVTMSSASGSTLTGVTAGVPTLASAAPPDRIDTPTVASAVVDGIDNTPASAVMSNSTAVSVKPVLVPTVVSVRGDT